MNVRKPPISVDILRDLLIYDPQVGALTWRYRPIKFFTNGRKKTAEQKAQWWNKRYAGEPALCTPSAKDGYLRGVILGRMYLAQRVCWALHAGAWPSGEIDHKNQTRNENWFDNLRDATHQENGKNQRLRSTNTSGHMGVSWIKATKKWQVCIMSDGRNVFIKQFSEKNEAVAAAATAYKSLGFHENHGKQGVSQWSN